MVEVDAPDARELVVARGEHESTGGVETDRADDVRVPRAGVRGGVRGGGGGGGVRARGGVRGGGDGGVGVEVGRERDEAVEREVVHADGRAEGDGDERAGGMRRDQRGRRLAHLLLAPALAGAALARASTAALAAATLVPASLASHRDDRASPRESNETCRSARVECAGRRASRAPRCDRWPSNGARASRSARAAARGNRGADPHRRACFVVSTHLTISATNVPEGVVATNVSDPEKNAPGVRMSIQSQKNVKMISVSRRATKKSLAVAPGDSHGGARA